LPGGQGTSSGGERQFVPALARAAVAVGVDALFNNTTADANTPARFTEPPRRFRSIAPTYPGSLPAGLLIWDEDVRPIMFATN